MVNQTAGHFEVTICDRAMGVFPADKFGGDVQGKCRPPDNGMARARRTGDLPVARDSRAAGKNGAAHALSGRIVRAGASGMQGNQLV